MAGYLSPPHLSVHPDRMSAAELRAGASLAGVYGLRMLGLFFILPIFAVHAKLLKGGEDLFLVGIAIGGHGLPPGLLQNPFGTASDRRGRKPPTYIALPSYGARRLSGLAANHPSTAIGARLPPGP